MSKLAIQSTNFGYTVEQRPWIENGKNTGFYGNFRMDTGECLGVTSEKYGLIQNEILIETAIAALKTRGFGNYEQRVVVTGKGERMFCDFSFKDKRLATALGDTVGYRLTLKNSFDRSMRAAFALGFLRLTCWNGNTALEKEFGLTQKHNSKVSVDFVGKAIDMALDKGKDAIRTFDRLAEVAITDEQGVNILGQFALAKVLSDKLREEMETLWLHPTRDADKARNLYNLYNAVTEHLTHKVSPDRFEYANTVNGNVLVRLVNAIRSPERLAKLVVPVPKKVGTVVTVDPESVGEAAGADVVEVEVVG